MLLSSAPSASHSTAPSGADNGTLEQYIPKDLDQPIFAADGTVNLRELVGEVRGRNRDHVQAVGAHLGGVERAGLDAELCDHDDLGDGRADQGRPASL